MAWLAVGRRATAVCACHATPHRTLRDGFARSAPKRTGTRKECLSGRKLRRVFAVGNMAWLAVGRRATAVCACHATPHRTLRDGFARSAPKRTGTRKECLFFLEQMTGIEPA